jgi:iron-sulfur cluster assembly accessory protein
MEYHVTPESPQHNQVGLSITPAANAHVRSILARKPKATALRLKIKRSGCSGFMYAPETAESVQPKEIKLDFADGLVILVAEQDIELIRGTEIDLVVKQLNQKQIIFNNPNAINSCGCGESFAVREKDAE